MLVLSRKVAERFYIGSEICVTVVRLGGSQVRLGIEAPPDVLIRREACPQIPPPQSRKNNTPPLRHSLALRRARPSRDLGEAPETDTQPPAPSRSARDRRPASCAGS